MKSILSYPIDSTYPAYPRNEDHTDAFDVAVPVDGIDVEEIADGLTMDEIDDILFAYLDDEYFDEFDIDEFDGLASSLYDISNF